jgi:hypothetical protein
MHWPLTPSLTNSTFGYLAAAMPTQLAPSMPSVWLSPKQITTGRPSPLPSQRQQAIGQHKAMEILVMAMTRH